MQPTVRPDRCPKLRAPRPSRGHNQTVAASGDGDRQLPTDTVGGNQSGTQDFAFNSLGFANTGLAFAPALSNTDRSRLSESGSSSTVST